MGTLFYMVSPYLDKVMIVNGRAVLSEVPSYQIAANKVPMRGFCARINSNPKRKSTNGNFGIRKWRAGSQLYGAYVAALLEPAVTTYIPRSDSTAKVLMYMGLRPKRGV